MQLIVIPALLLTAALAQGRQQPPAAEAPAVPAPAPVRGPGSRHLSAMRAPTALKVEGALDEETWKRADVADGFTQTEPGTGQPATEATEVRVAYDANNLYIRAYMHDREPDKIIINDIKKDFYEVDEDDFEVILDTFRDRHNGYMFLTNAAGAKADRLVASEGREVNGSWDAVWSVRTRIVRDGWIADITIPFRGLRFDPNADGTWGINFARRIRRKNEIDCWAPIPREYNVMRLSLAGDLEGVHPVDTPHDLRLKPYVLAKTVRDVGVTPYTSSGAAGVDLKTALGRSLTFDVTVNPDFAQVEADEQQVNLTQFSQFFPEKREFFLENSGMFYVGDAARNNQVSSVTTPDEDLLLFFSRRIGLTANGTPTPIPFGARLTGTTDGIGIGALAMRTDATDSTPASTYSALRLKRNLAPGSDVGVFYLGRDGAGPNAGYNHVFGVDENIRFGGVVDWNSFLVKSETPGKTTGQYAWRTSVNYEAQFIHVKVASMELGQGFEDDLGYYRRTDVRKYFLDMGLRPRSSWLQEHGIRELHPHVTWNYYDDVGGATIGKYLHNGQTFFFNDGGYTEFSANVYYNFLTDSLRLNRADPGAQQIAPGGYQWTQWQWIYNTNPSRPLSLGLTAIGGGLWSGTQKTVNATVNFHPGYHFRISTGVQHTSATLDRPNQKFDATLWTARTTYSFTTAMFLDALAQYDAAIRQFNTNIRFNLIHHPLSDLFLVYNEQRFTTPDAPVVGRSLVLKVTQMLSP
ncbi:MAG: carbohydrate binding family 9 domain-containing protein [Gemmatimonadetes bacterium]|nr:carbohydrate binding family 9 domain-containing protein [Gemmatimonadota bacterium]